MRMETDYEEEKQRENYFLPIAGGHIHFNAFPVFLDGTQFIYDKQGNYDGADTMAGPAITIWIISGMPLRGRLFPDIS